MFLRWAGALAASAIPHLALNRRPISSDNHHAFPPAFRPALCMRPTGAPPPASTGEPPLLLPAFVDRLGQYPQVAQIITRNVMQRNAWLLPSSLQLHDDADRTNIAE